MALDDSNFVFDVYDSVRNHLVSCLDILSKANFENSLLYRSLHCYLTFINDLL